MYHIKFPNRTASLLTLNDEFAYVEPALTPEAHAALCLFVPDVVVDAPEQETKTTLARSDVNKTKLTSATKPLEKGDSVIVMLSDNSRTHSMIVATPDEANYTTVQCVWNGDQKTYFDRAALVYVLPSVARRASLQDIQKGDHLIVVAGDDVKDATRRKPDEILLGDIVTFDSWVPADGEMKVRLQCHEGLHNAARFQKA